MTYEIVPLTYTHLEPAFHLATEVFVNDSTLHRALQTELQEYQVYLRSAFEKMVFESLSVIAIDKRNDTLVGCLIATDFHQHLAPTIKPEGKFAPLSALTNELCAQYQHKRQITRGDAVLVDMGAVSPDHARNRIYQNMRDAIHSIAKSKGYKTIIGELSSGSTQYVILNKLGHTKLAEVAFADFTHAGEKPFQTIREPTSIILAEGKL